MKTLSCGICGTSEDEKRLSKCPICFKPFCEDCGSMMSGRKFCSKYCAEYFFHAEEDEL
jgi:hypothetical protein